ncbi:hypothetical protein H9P43_009784 [Blastocladiella emersonii ATCC 22665]|nr:hypothetical protein H9P43_009784 [Blastocladiella emersonii ATCC 22665]
MALTEFLDKCPPQLAVLDIRDTYCIVDDFPENFPPSLNKLSMTVYERSASDKLKDIRDRAPPTMFIHTEFWDEFSKFAETRSESFIHLVYRGRGKEVRPQLETREGRDRPR